MGMDRDLVLIVGEGEIDSTPFLERDLKIERVAQPIPENLLKDARAVLIADFPGKFTLVKECYGNLLSQAYDNGLTFVVIARSTKDHPQIVAIREAAHAVERSSVFGIGDLKRTAEDIRRLDISPAKGNVAIEPSHLILSYDERLLLQRAFHDCESIYIEPLAGGKASLSVFRVHARLKQSDVGPHPLPFFVKIAEPKLADDEKSKYHAYAEHYIPFNLRPNLVGWRCVRTSMQSALVGNFVGDAIPLRKSLRAGQCGTIFSLFETTLRGFRLQPAANHAVPMADFLAGFVKGRIQASEIPPERTDYARATLGLSTDPIDLVNALYSKAKKIKCLVGPYHGDLHTGNIMIRGGDAILIDFSSTDQGPLTADPAALEASLLFGTDEGDVPDSFDEWRSFLDEIYQTEPSFSLRPPILFESQPGRFSWLRRPLRELRHVLLGCDCDKAEAEIVLAAYLVRYARLPIEDLSDEKLKKLAFSRHAYALVIAERIINELCNKSTLQ